MRTICTEVFQYDELSESAQQKAREWFAQDVFGDSSYWDHIYEDATTIAGMLGITFSQNLAGDGKRLEPAIYFTGFSSQGDGASYDGAYEYKPDSVAAVTEHAPHDAELHRIARDLAAIQERNANKVRATCRQSGRYYHSRSMDIEVCGEDDGAEIPHDDIGRVNELLRDFADWIYRQLCSEYEYQTSDEAVAENIRANECEFTADGKRAG